MIYSRDPVVSIIITAYQYERYIANCIESCLAQTTKLPFEVIVIDDGSLDLTAAVARNYEPHIKVYSITNGGVEKASNYGFTKARGKFVVRVDADDSLKPNFIKIMEPYLQQDDWAFYYSNYSVIDSEGNKVSQVNLPAFNTDEIYERGDFLATGTLYRMDLLKRLGFYNEELPNCGLENYELILRLLAAQAKGLHIGETLFFYRIHSRNMSLIRREKIIKHGFKIAERFGLNTYKTNVNHPYNLVL
jgi:glycosyltransferase involved in cell wall biosynthesis